MNKFEIGLRVKPSLYEYQDIVGTILSIFNNIAVIKIEKAIYYKIGSTISFYEKDLELIRVVVDSTSIYQYCNKCDVLTTNKPSLCCDHKL